MSENLKYVPFFYLISNNYEMKQGIPLLITFQNKYFIKEYQVESIDSNFSSDIFLIDYSTFKEKKYSYEDNYLVQSGNQFLEAIDKLNLDNSTPPVAPSND